MRPARSAFLPARLKLKQRFTYLLAVFTSASLHYLRHLAANAGILLLLVAFILFQATAPRYRSTPRLSSTQARRAWGMYAGLVLLAVLAVGILWWLG